MTGIRLFWALVVIGIFCLTAHYLLALANVLAMVGR